MSDGKNLRTGLFGDVPEQTYHAGEGISSSDLRKMAKSVKKYFDKTPQKAPSPALRLGSAFHMAVLEPDRYEAEYQLVEKVDRRKKEVKELLAEGVQLLSFAEHDQIMGMRDSVFESPLTRNLFKDGKAEQSAYWYEKPNLVPDAEPVYFKARIDYLKDDGVAIDLKSTMDASFSGFFQSIGNFKYHIQAAQYIKGLQETMGKELRDFIFVAVEKEPPYAVNTFSLDDVALDKGFEQRDLIIKKYVDWISTDNPLVKNFTYEQKINSIGLPAWAMINSNIVEA